jgi:predicted dehydrogenase
MNDISRRSFAIGALSYSKILGANDRIRMGYIGVGNRGDQVHDAFLEHGDQQTVAVCDLRDDYMEFAAKKAHTQPKKYKDYHKLLEDKDVDAVVIATPDHWHALMLVDACHAGKDVYVEKPLSLTVREGRRMVEVATETRRVVQVGIQHRSASFLAEAADAVRSGEIGQVTVAKAFHVQNEWPGGIGNPPNTAPPSEAEWNQWLGPAPYVPYNLNREFYRFRWFYNYSGGQLTNFGVHHMDMIRWCLGQGAPLWVTALGGKFAVHDNREIPDTLEALWQFDGPTLVTFSQYNANGAPWNAQNSQVELRGTKGTLYLHPTRWEIVPEKVTEEAFPARTPLDRKPDNSYRASRHTVIEPRDMIGSPDTAFHTRNFLDCVKSRAKCNCDIETGHLSTSATLIANVAHKTKSCLEWDSKAERFPNHAAANGLLSYPYRAPYKLG